MNHYRVIRIYQSVDFKSLQFYVKIDVVISTNASRKSITKKWIILVSFKGTALQWSVGIKKMDSS